MNKFVCIDVQKGFANNPHESELMDKTVTLKDRLQKQCQMNPSKQLKFSRMEKANPTFIGWAAGLFKFSYVD